MADLIIANPTAQDAALAAALDRTAWWVGMVRRSDMFREILHRRQGEVCDPILKETVEGMLQVVAEASLEKLYEKIARPAEEIPDNLLIAAATLGAKGLGVGGFSNKPAPAPAPPPSDRFERLAERLLNLNGVRPQEISDATVLSETGR